MHLHHPAFQQLMKLMARLMIWLNFHVADVSEDAWDSFPCPPGTPDPDLL